MRRGLAGILLCAGGAFAAVAVAGWWTQRIVLDPDSSRAAAGAIYADELVSSSVANLVADYTTQRVGIAADQMAITFVADIEPMLADRVVNTILDDLAADAHAALVGVRDEPVVLTGLDLVMLVRTEAVGDLEPLVIPVERSTTLDYGRIVVNWTVPIAAGAGLLCVLLGLAARPGRADLLLALGVAAITGAVLGFVLLYLAPRYGAPLVSAAPWSALLPAIAEHYLTSVAIATGIAGIAGVLLILASYGIGSRASKSWSTPVRSARYADQPKWSR